jgi:hypothetical protein
MKHVKEELDKFRKRVIQQAKSNLTKQRKNASKKLYNGIKSNLEVYQSDNFLLEFDLGNYGEFVDKGVSGNKKKYNTPFKFTTKQPPSSVILPWIKQRNIKGRDKNGRFIKQKSLAFLIARSIKQNGLKPSLYFTKPFNNEFKKLSDYVVESVGLDNTLKKYE